jgi:ferredoxin
MCSGTRNCERYYPDIFVVNRDKAWIKSGIEWASADVALLKEVESACPWAAIEVEAPAD